MTKRLPWGCAGRARDGQPAEQHQVSSSAGDTYRLPVLDYCWQASTRTKDAVCDALRDMGRPKLVRPDFADEADLPLLLSCFRDRVILYRDMSGASLHKRGYRDAMHKASLNEAVAAGVLQLAGWPAAVKHAAQRSQVNRDPTRCGERRNETDTPHR